MTTLTPSTLLAQVPSGLRDPLIAEFKSLSAAFSESKWKYAALDSGRFCETVYTILDGALKGKYASAPAKPANFPQACSDLEKLPKLAVGDRSIRLMLPRALPPVYEVRNNRNVGHVGGEVQSNKMDAAYTVASCKFIFAELVRVFHGCSTSEAQAVVDALADRNMPLVWDFGEGKRVLSTKISYSDATLSLLYSCPGWVNTKDLIEWSRYSSASLYKSNVLKKLDRELMIVYDKTNERCQITPLGASRVETILIPDHSEK